jgi:hypothetical protein
MVRISNLSGVPFRSIKQPLLPLSGTAIRTTVDRYNFVPRGMVSVKNMAHFLTSFHFQQLCSYELKITFRISAFSLPLFCEKVLKGVVYFHFML